jgi:hypothetical protein
MTEIVPTERMSTLRRVLDMDYALEGNPASKYQASVVRWLPGQLPGHDLQNVGWGLLLIAVAATPKPERGGSNAAVKAGMRSVMLNAGMVGKALIDSDSPGPAPELSPDVGWDLADLRPAMAKLAEQTAADLPPGLDIAEATGEALGILRDLFPDADVSGTGWAALGTGTVLAKEVQEAYNKVAQGHIRRRLREQREQWGNGAMFAAIVLARMGDSLINQGYRS